MLSCHISSPMLVSCCRLIVSSVVASRCCELQVYHSVIFPLRRSPQFCKYTLYRHLVFGRFIFVLRYVFLFISSVESHHRYYHHLHVYFVSRLPVR